MTDPHPVSEPTTTHTAPAKNPFFPLVTVTVGLFIITIFVLIATMFGDPNAPVAQLFAKYGGLMLGIEVVAFLIVGPLALLVDRRQALRDLQNYEAAQAAKRVGTTTGQSSSSPEHPA